MGPASTDLSGRRFGRLVVLKFDEKRGGLRYWLCQCDCGNPTSVATGNLNSGATSSCGCVRREVAAAKGIARVGVPNPGPRMPPVDHSGKKFGKLTAVRLDAIRVQHWHCVCDCGNEKSIATTHLVSGHTRSCGCLEPLPKSPSNVFRPSRHPLYNRWWSMLRRCNNPNEIGYARYGGRGIRVCDRWKVFENFLSDVGDPPSPAHTMDRIDNDGNYEPSNFRWATMKEQCVTRRKREIRETT